MGQRQQHEDAAAEDQREQVLFRDQLGTAQRQGVAVDVPAKPLVVAEQIDRQHGDHDGRVEQEEQALAAAKHGHAQENRHHQQQYLGIGPDHVQILF